MSLEDICFEVCTALESVGTRAILTGGSAATFYAPDVYQSLDADFVIAFGNSKEAGRALEARGFTQNNGVYHRKGTKYTLEFPPGPLAIGSEYITDYATFHRSGGEVLYVLHALDCVRDRLLWYYHYGDISALKAAAGVAKAQQVDAANLRAWSERENAVQKFELFIRQIESL
jgi:hypothetical protein